VNNNAAATEEVKKGEAVKEVNKNTAFRKSNFQDVIGEVHELKKELFGNADADMKFYRANKNAYFDSQWLQRAQKIAKVLELEELLEFYEKNKKGDTKDTKIADQKKETALTKENKAEKSVNNRKEETKKEVTKEAVVPKVQEKAASGDAKKVEKKKDEGLDKITIAKEDSSNLRKN